MTDKEIIKALECCISSGDCKGCPSYIEKDDDCLGIKWSSILDLINRLQAEISVKRKLLEKAEETINEQQAEIDNWEKQFRILDVECSRLEKQTEELQAEIERLNIELQAMRISANSFKNKYKSAVNTAKELQSVIKDKDATIEMLEEMVGEE